MLRIIHPNRWFFWTVAIAVGSTLALLLFISQAAREWEEQSLELVAQSRMTWKIYSSKALGLAVRYPPTWQIEIDPLESNTVALEDPQNFQENISIFVLDPALQKIFQGSFKDNSQRELTIDGYPAKWFRTPPTKASDANNIVLVVAKGKLYYITGTSQFFERIIKGIKL